MENLLDYLPHGRPFRLLDKVMELTETRGVGIKNVSANDPLTCWFLGVSGTLPDLLIVEAMAQLAGLVMNCGKAEGKVALLAQIKFMRFYRPVSVSEQLEVVSELNHALPPLAAFSVKAFVDGAVVAEGDLVMADADG